MSISSTTNRNTYTGADTTSNFSYSFRIFSNTDLRVFVRRTSTGVITVLTLTTDYTVNGVGDSSGTIDLVNSSQAWLTAGKLATGYTLTVRRVRALTQSADIGNQGEYYPEIHEDAFDKLVMIAQQLDADLDRSIKAPEDETSMGELPSSTDRASKYLAFDSSGGPIASDGGISASVPVSAFGETLIDDADAGAALTTLGFSAYVKTLVSAATAAAMRTLLGFAGTGGLVQAAQMEDGTITKVKLDSTTTSMPNEVSNLSLTCSVGSSALTIALKGQDGNNPSATNPVSIGFRSSTATSGVYNQRRATAATSVVVSSGSTLGHTSAKEAFIYVYAIDNAGTVELAVSSKLFDEGTIQSTTAEGGAGASDSIVGLYSTTARSNVPIRLIGRLRSTQATAGTWAAVPTEIAIAPSAHPPAVASASRTGGNVTVADATVTTIVCDNEIFDSNGVYDPSTGIYTVDEEGAYLIGCTACFTSTVSFSGTGEVCGIGYDINSGASQVNVARMVPPTSTPTLYLCGTAMVYLKKGDALKWFIFQNSGANMTLDGSGSETRHWLRKA